MSFPPCGFYRTDQYPLSFRTAVFAHPHQGLGPTEHASHVKTPFSCNIDLVDASGTPSASTWVDSIAPIEKFADATYFADLCKYNKTGANELYYGHCTENKTLGTSPYTCDSQYTNTFYEQLPIHAKASAISTEATQCNANCNEVLKNITFKGISANSEIGKEVWALRKAHGIGMTLVTTFFIPWNNFNTGYMKETHLEKKLAHLPVWYMTHFILSTSIMGVLLASYATGIWGRTFFGFSMTVPGKIHVFVGWLSAIIFVLTYFSSGFRSSLIKSRHCSVFFHFLGGMLHYALSLVAMLTSCLVPGSPSGFSDININDYQLELEEPLFGGVVVWILIDTAFNIGMMISMKCWDKKRVLKNKRKFALGVVPIPVSKLDSTFHTGYSGWCFSKSYVRGLCACRLLYECRNFCHYI